MSGQEICFSTLPHHPAGRQQTCRTRLSVDKSIEATTPHGPATWLASCVLGVARRFEYSEVMRTAYRACTSDGRPVGARTERAPNLRGTEGVKARANGRGRGLGRAPQERLPLNDRRGPTRPSILWLGRAAFDAVMPCRLWLLGWRDVRTRPCAAGCSQPCHTVSGSPIREELGR